MHQNIHHLLVASRILSRPAILAAALALFPGFSGRTDADGPLRVAVFSADVTIPLGHRCMGVLPTKSAKIVDPLQAHGFVLLGDSDPVVLVAVDWCEIRNGAYDRWRDVLAQAAGTRRERVLVHSVHQHDAPVADTDAENLLKSVGLGGELCDPAFHETAVQRVAAALRAGLASAKPVTHIGLGQAKVKKIASNRRVVLPDGKVTFSRYSRSGGSFMDAPEGLIDPMLKTISLWNGGRALVAVHAYAVHPMSYYGKGGVSYDFPGMARESRRRDDPGIQQIYVSGCSGDVVAGKYNDGSPENRPVLAGRLYEAMKDAWKNTRKIPVKQASFRSAPLQLDFHDGEPFTGGMLRKKLEDKDAKVEDRILAAMGLASRNRVARGQPIDLPCIDFGPAQLVLLPGEAFVGYQLMAQQLRPDSFVMAIGYGECWPGYIPTRSAFEDKFGQGWRWIAPGAEARMRSVLERVLVPAKRE